VSSLIIRGFWANVRREQRRHIQKRCYLTILYGGDSYTEGIVVAWRDEVESLYCLWVFADSLQCIKGWLIAMFQSDLLLSKRIAPGLVPCTYITFLYF
jgi:hypothetical protein